MSEYTPKRMRRYEQGSACGIMPKEMAREVRILAGMAEKKSLTTRQKYGILYP